MTSRAKALRLTQRLDHMVPDPKISAVGNAEAARKLADISKALSDLLPDPSLSPDERLERLARIVADRTPQGEHLLPAAQKLAKLERRLTELVPGDGLSAADRLNRLVEATNAAVPTSGLRFVEKLETLGDVRAGIAAVRQ